MNTNIFEIEKKAKDLLSSIQLIKINPKDLRFSSDFTIDSFFENISGLEGFIKSMRPNGYFGMSPQNQQDLDNRDIVLEKLREIREFVIANYEKNKEIVNK